MEWAKETGCSIRRLNVLAASSRPWVSGDDPVTPSAVAKPGENNSGFALEWRPVTVSLSGPSSGLKSLLEKLAGANMLMHTKLLEMYPSSGNRQSLTLDMELWYFTLVRRG
jgi:hypothetical protein